jgi:hypothetical protein
VTDTARNQGQVGAAASTTRYYLSLDTVKGAGDVLLTAAVPCPRLAVGGLAGDSSTGNATVDDPVHDRPRSILSVGLRR